jgi:hypothetical protein
VRLTSNTPGCLIVCHDCMLLCYSDPHEQQSLSHQWAVLTACIAKRSRLQRHKGACQTLQGAETIAAAVAVAVCALSCTPVAVPADTPLAAAAAAADAADAGAGAGVAFAAAIGARYLQLISKLRGRMHRMSEACVFKLQHVNLLEVGSVHDLWIGFECIIVTTNVRSDMCGRKAIFCQSTKFASGCAETAESIMERVSLWDYPQTDCCGDEYCRNPGSTP